MSNHLIQLELFHLRLSFRGKFSHAVAQRDSTETVIAAALLADGTMGFGEGLPRPYVTGETIDSLLYNIENTLVGKLERMEPKTFAELLERVDNLPFTNEQGKTINSARCCVELALLDAYGKYFNCGLSGIAGWLGYAGFAGGGRMDQVRVSGVLDASEPRRMLHKFRMMWWYGLRDFKLKLGGEHDLENLELLYRRLKKHITIGQASLRVDANGSWDIDTALSMTEELKRFQVCSLEQPLAREDHSHWRILADLGHVPLMADESLVSLQDAEYLIDNDLIDYFNIRISKNGGLLPAIRLAEMAATRGRRYQLGAMVGETAILAAAGRQFLQMVPDISFTEICYGTFLLRQDLSRQKMRFGYGGKLSVLPGVGLGVNIGRDKINNFLASTPRKIDLA